MSLERTMVRERSVSPSTRGLSDMLDSPIGRETSLLSYADRSCNGTMVFYSSQITVTIQTILYYFKMFFFTISKYRHVKNLFHLGEVCP